MERSLTASEMLRAMRRESGLSQREFAARVGTSGPTIAAYERGHKEPKLSTLERFAARLGVSVPTVRPPVDRAERLRERRRRRSLALAAATAEAVARDWDAAVRIAERNLAGIAEVVGDNVSRERLDKWRTVIARGPAAVRRTLLASGPDAEVMRAMEPFAGILSDETRLTVLALVDVLDAA